MPKKRLKAATYFINIIAFENILAILEKARTDEF
jgi:hypothetical protein